MSAWTVPSYADDWAVPGYTQGQELGRGTSGKVMEAVNDATGQRVAIKYLSHALVRDPAFMWGFRTEAQMLRSLGVPQVVQVYDYVEQPGQGAAIVMELVDGVSLHEMIARRGPTGPEAALAVLKGSLLGLAAAHTLGIVHRDYKPENVLVDTAGNSKLADFGVAIKTGKQAPAAGTPLYMAPEQWQGAPASPATDVYAATAVFFECLTGKTPFSGKLTQLREQHVTASVPLDRVDAPLRGLIAQGLAKNQAGRPQSAIAFVAELEAVAGAAYGQDWEERGRSHLAERAAALLPLLLHSGHAGSSGTSYASTWFGGGGGRGGRRRRAITVAAIATAAVVVIGAAATAVTLSAKNHQVLKGSSQVATVTPTFKAAATVTPPVTASQCSTPNSFTYTGTLTATERGTLSYRWVYSTGQQGPVRTVSFTGAGHRTVSGGTVKAKAAGTGWAEIKTISPIAETSDKATYKLLCGKPGTSQITASASVLVPAGTVTCGTTPPNLTATGSITSTKAGTVTYYWAQSNGQDSSLATVTFTAPNTTMAVAPLTITPPGDPASGAAVLVVTSPVAAASSSATYALSCKPVTPSLSATAAVSPASQTLTSCTAAAPAFTFSGTISDNKAGPVSYHWKLPSGNGPAQTLNFTKAGSQTVTTTYKPSSDSASGSGSLVVTSPAGVTSKAAAFTLTCDQALTIANNAPATATVGTAYSGTVTVSGGKGTYAWAAVTGLPAGLTSSANGATLTISGTPTAAGASAIKLSVHDSATPPGTGTTSLTLTVSAPAMAIASNAAATATVGKAYSGTVTVSGGNGTYAWAAVTGLPAGLTSGASGATLTISGTPTAAGASTVTLTASDTEATPKTATTTLTITVSAPPVSITTGSLPGGTLRTAYTATVAATGGTGSITWAASGLPAGLAINSATGTISGTPGASGTFTVAVTATAVTSASATFTLVINPVVIASSPAPAVTATPTATSTIVLE